MNKEILPQKYKFVQCSIKIELSLDSLKHLSQKIPAEANQLKLQKIT